LELRAPALPRRLVGRAAVGGYRSWVRVRDKLFSLASAGGYASFGSNSVIQLPVRVHGASRIAVGSGVFVGANSWLQVLSGGEGPAITIGDGAAIAGHCVLSATESITIGSNVSLARNVYIADHTHAYTEADRPVLAQGLAGISGVEIGDGAWLGENVTVLPGVRIGCGAVVGANSVVGSDIPDYALALGAPARVVRRFGAAPDA
jgi:lipopolysaccharide O-acetyltransferase